MEKQELQERELREQIAAALSALRFSYSPYSGFSVGAALRAESGRIYTGCNIENAAFTPGNCAERTAFFKAVSEGEKCFESIVIVGGRSGKVLDFCPPCGVCRQVMQEFCRPDTFKIILAVSEQEYRSYHLCELLPQGFGPDHLSEA